MNKVLELCPKCAIILTMIIQRNTIINKCTCGYSKTINLQSYLNVLKEHDNCNVNTSNFPLITISIEQAYHHLKSYFKTLKEHSINKLLLLINEIESSYEESYKRNINILSLIQILINNYNSSQNMKNNIISNSHFNIYLCNSNPTIQDIIYYYKHFEINLFKEQKKIIIENIKSIKEESPSSLLLLRDKRIACTSEHSIKIYDPSKDYLCAQILKRHNGAIQSICQLNDGTIVSCSVDKSIQIGEYFTIQNAHNKWISKIITLPKNRIASCSADKTIKIWKSDSPYCNIPISTLIGHRSWVQSIIYIKDRDILISGSLDNSIGFWNISTYDNIKMIDAIKCGSTNSFYQIDSNRIILGDYNTFCIINIDKYEIENQVIEKEEQFKCIHCFNKLS